MFSESTDLVLTRNDLCFTNGFQSFLQYGVYDRLEAELGTARRDWFDDPRDIVADEAETCRLCPFLYRAPESRLPKKNVLDGVYSHICRDIFVFNCDIYKLHIILCKRTLLGCTLFPQMP